MTSLRLFVIISNVAARCALDAAIAQSVEHVIGNDEVIGPNPISSSINKGEVRLDFAFVYAVFVPIER